MKTTTLQLKHSMNRSHWPLALLLIPLALACFALSPQAQAVCRQGCDVNNTFLGEDALPNTGGAANTAIGYQALFSNTGGSENTAIGSGALTNNTLGVHNTATGASALFNNTVGLQNTA